MSGGSALAALSIFKIFQVTNSFQPRKKHDGHGFYKTCLQPNYWLFGLSTRAELEEYFGGSLRDIFSDESFFVDSDGEDEDIEHIGSERESENDKAKDGNGAVASFPDHVGNEASGAVCDSVLSAAVSGTQPSQPTTVEDPTGAKVGTDGSSQLAPEEVHQHSSKNEPTELALNIATQVTEAQRLKDPDATPVGRGKSEKDSESPARSTAADQQIQNSDESVSRDLNTVAEIGLQQESGYLTSSGKAKSKQQEKDQEQLHLAALKDPQSVSSTTSPDSEILQHRDPPNNHPQKHFTGEMRGASRSSKVHPLASDSLVGPKSGKGKRSKFCTVV